jgi:glutamate-ammonia-ligase adenylyltransferase
LALIARRLLEGIARTPAPDATLANLGRVSDSLGGKGVLWELFSFHPPSLDLYIRLCSSSPYLTAILTNNPGMIDELLDSLMLAKLPSLRELQRTLDDLCGDADDLEPILHSFKNTQHLNVGVRELLGRADIRDATATLADVAEACVQRIVQDQYGRLVRKYGQPYCQAEDRPCELVILAMGKFGGREPNYHSDVDVVYLYEANGQTRLPSTVRGRETTSNQHFFCQLGHRIVRNLSDTGPYGRLYDSDARLRPTSETGPLAGSLNEFRDYHLGDDLPLASLRALCQARPVYGSESIRARTAEMLREILVSAPPHGLGADVVRAERFRLQASAGPRNLKRGPGGAMDIEFIVQTLQLRHAAAHPGILLQGTLESLEALAEAGIMDPDESEFFRESYRFLRQVEARLRLLNTTARHDLPREAGELAKLAYLLRFDDSHKLEAECARFTRENRRRFDRFTAA